MNGDYSVNKTGREDVNARWQWHVRQDEDTYGLVSSGFARTREAAIEAALYAGGRNEVINV